MGAEYILFSPRGPGYLVVCNVDQAGLELKVIHRPAE